MFLSNKPHIVGPALVCLDSLAANITDSLQSLARAEETKRFPGRRSGQAALVEQQWRSFTRARPPAKKQPV